MKRKITILFAFISINIIAQSTARESWSFGIGVHNFYMHGDLRSIESGLSDTENNLINLGSYIYVDKMVSTTFGFEAKFSYSKMSGVGQELSSSHTVGGVPVSQLRFEGNAYAGELNTIINLSGYSRDPYKTKERKWGVFGTLGVGIHRYDSKLYEINSNNLLADFGESPSKNGSTSSMYFTSGIGLKYKLTPKIDIEF